MRLEILARTFTVRKRGNPPLATARFCLACIRAISLVLMAAFSSIQTARALNPLGAPVIIRVRLEAKPEPIRAVGILFSPASSQQFEQTSISKIGDKLYEISFSVPASSLREDAVASALGFDETGKISFANVTPANSTEGTELLASIPECPGEDGSRVAGMTSPGTLQQLVDVRTERMNIVRVKISRLMDQTFLPKLQKFEEAFGLTYATPLSPDLPPAELIERLSRIHNAVRKYQRHQPKVSKEHPTSRPGQ